MTVVDPDPRRARLGVHRRAGHDADPVNGFAFLREAYSATRPGYDGRVTVPVLWDRERGRIVNNESSEIIRMLDTRVRRLREAPRAPLPAGRPARRDRRAQRVRLRRTSTTASTARASRRTQAAYEDGLRRAVRRARLARRAARRRAATCSATAITEADWRLFTTLVRFDAVYVGHFKCNLRRIVDYPQPVGLPARPLPAPGHRRDRRLRPHQAPLLPHAPAASTRRGIVPDRARRSTSRRRTTARRSAADPIGGGGRPHGGGGRRGREPAVPRPHPAREAVARVAGRDRAARPARRDARGAPRRRRSHW